MAKNKVARKGFIAKFTGVLVEAVKRLSRLETYVDFGVEIQLIKGFGTCLVRLREMQN